MELNAAPRFALNGGSQGVLGGGMAKPKLVKCRVCGHNVSDQAPTCPSCGDAVAERMGKERSNTSLTTKVAAWTIAVIGVLVVISVATDGGQRANQAAAPAEASPAVPKAVVEPGPFVATMDDEEQSATARRTAAQRLISNFPEHEAANRAKELIPLMQGEEALEASRRKWSYSRSEDPMTSKVNIRASIRSENRHEFDFPYGEPQRATLAIRRHPRYGNDVIFQIDRGQLLCRSYGDCSVRLRFDDGQARTVRGSPPSDGSSETIFIPSYADFTRRLGAAKTLRIEANVYKQGAPVWEFDVSGFDPEQLK